MLKDAHFMSIADRSILACWGVKGGLAGKPFQVTIDPGGPNEREVDALADAEPVKAGEVIRIRTTGGGGWGDPLARDPELVVRDVVWRKVSPEAALADYGVVLTGSLDDDSLGHDADATAAERAARPGRRRGVLRPRSRATPGWPSGAAHADGRPGLMRVAVVGGHGKTGRAVGAALAGARPRGGRRWAAPTGPTWPEAMAGCAAAYLIAPNMHPDEPAYVGAALDAARAAGVGAGGPATRWPRRTSRRCRTTSARLRPRTSYAAAGLAWTILQPGAYLQNFDLTRTVRIAYAPTRRSGSPTSTTSQRRPRPCSPSPATTARRTSWPRGGRRSPELAAEAGVDVEVVTPMQWAATDGADLDERVRAWLLAMFAYYDAHGLPVGTLPLRTLLGR